MKLATFTKQPAEIKDYDVDYAPWLEPIGDTLDNVTTIVECISDASDTSLVVDSTANTSTMLKLWMSGGTAGQRYKVTIQVTTPAGRLDESELEFKIKDY